MATFYLNRFSNESVDSQWLRHLQANAYVNDLGGIVQKSRRDLQVTIQNASAEQSRAIQKVVGKLDDGFNQVNIHLRKINSNISQLRGEINEMASMLDWKLSLLVEEQRLTNNLLGHIAQLLRIPDSQKQRIYYIEQGLKYLKNAILEGIDSRFYSDALESFKEAEKIERKDFITLNRIGQIHLYSQRHLNIRQAEDYFLKAAREALAESNVGGTNTSKDFDWDNDWDDIYSDDPFKAAAAEAYLYASRACYLQKKFTEAAEYAAKANSLVPKFLQARFEQAKYLAANNKQNEAVNILQEVIAEDRLFAVKTLNDQDLSNKSRVLEMLESFHQKAISKAKEIFEACNRIVRPNSKAWNILEEARESISKDSFLSGMHALDLLEGRHEFDVVNNVAYSNSVRRNSSSAYLRVYDFIKKENESEEKFHIVKNQVKNDIIKDNAFNFGLAGCGLGFFVGCYRGCSVSSFSMDYGEWISSTIFFGVIFAIVGLIVGISTNPSVTGTED